MLLLSMSLTFLKTLFMLRTSLADVMCTKMSRSELFWRSNLSEMNSDASWNKCKRLCLINGLVFKALHSKPSGNHWSPNLIDYNHSIILDVVASILSRLKALELYYTNNYLSKITSDSNDCVWHAVKLLQSLGWGGDWGTMVLAGVATASRDLQFEIHLHFCFHIIVLGWNVYLWKFTKHGFEVLREDTHLVAVPANVLGVGVLERPSLNFFRENIFFVEKEDEGGAMKPSNVADGGEELQRFVQTVAQRTFWQFLKGQMEHSLTLN